MTISVCIATYRRPERLDLLLRDLAAQSLLPQEVIVVDNHAEGSARGIVDTFAVAAPFAMRYEIQPVRNIALTRNRTVALANQEWLAFIDDDERAPADWLAQLIDAAKRYSADGVLGPVEPVVPASAPAWIRRGRFYDFPHLPSGTPVPLNRMRFGNVILRGELVRAEPGPFNVAYELTTGEDADLLIRLMNRGALIVWSEEANVQEPIEPARQSLGWLLQRALSGGQEFARKTMAGHYGPLQVHGRFTLFSRALAQLATACLLALVTWPTGKHRGAAWLIKAAANFGKLSVFLGWRYREYA